MTHRPEPGDVDDGSDVVRAGRALLERCAQDLDGSPVGVVLCVFTATDVSRDTGVSVVARVVGTATHRDELDRIGLVPGSVWMAAQDRTRHFGRLANVRELTRALVHHEAWSTTVACAAAPIVDARRDVAVGVVAGTCATFERFPLLGPYVQLVARAIGDGLLGGATVADRMLLARFVRARRRSHGPMVAVNDREMLANAAAARLVDDDEHPRIWEWASRRLDAPEGSDQQIQLRAGSIAVRCEPVVVAGENVGVFLHLEEPASRRSVVRAAQAVTSGPHAGGWESLHPSEHGIAELVAQGLTNREIGARLFMSPHTVDATLRRIFRKLAISSRVELTRLVTEQSMFPEAG
jgi:DNA-binding CsgD family transcriptional regulator